MLLLFNDYLTSTKTLICFHKSCVDGLFSVILFLEGKQLSEAYYEHYILVPLTPNDILNKNKIREIEHKKKVILDLPYFGTNVEYYFDHHITNEELVSNNTFTGLFDSSAASTCEVLKIFFKMDKKPETSLLIDVANTIDQALFSTSPPPMGPLDLTTTDDIIWACNDLIKDVRDENQLLELFDSFDKNDLRKWIKKHKNHVLNYRKRRQQTLDLKKDLEKAPIILIVNNSYQIQAEGLHFSLAAEEKNYKMLVLIDKIKNPKKTTKDTYRVSFRLNPRLDEKTTNILRVDKIAKELGGGGHKAAASAGIENLNPVFETILNWIKELHIDYSINEF